MIDERTLWEILDFVAKERQIARRNIVALDDYHAGAEELAAKIEEKIRGKLPPRNADRCPQCGLFVYDLIMHIRKEHGPKPALQEVS